MNKWWYQSINREGVVKKAVVRRGRAAGHHHAVNRVPLPANTV